MNTLESDTLALMRRMMDPTANLSDLFYTEGFEAEAHSFEDFSEEFFEAVAADEILSIYDQEHLRELVRLSCQLSLLSVDHSPTIEKLQSELDLQGESVIDSVLFLLTNPSIEMSQIKDILSDFETEYADLLRAFAWALFVYNPRGQQLFQECFALEPNWLFVQLLFSEIQLFLQREVIMDHNEESMSWGNWIAKGFQEAQVNQRACHGEDMFALEGWYLRESWEGEAILGDSFFVHRGTKVQEVQAGFDKMFFPPVRDWHWTMEEVASRYTSLARWTRALARLDGMEEPTFALERVF